MFGKAAPRNGINLRLCRLVNDGIRRHVPGGDKGLGVHDKVRSRGKTVLPFAW